MTASNTLSYKDLVVWQKSLEFANKVIEITETLKTQNVNFRLLDQLTAACTSIPMNIAEGKGRFSNKEFKHYMVIARGSLFETMTLIEIFKLRNWISQENYNTLQNEAIQITKMINSLNRSITPIERATKTE
ncbi:MAG: four helix bundle protein [Chloroflexi bacterium HGW-Chloroflexi-8]|jgi:four helix bundle protein|nr:MAG: four helix bundle protein [Chloroflexi bacterium HGW-Chloroflexi-8]